MHLDELNTDDAVLAELGRRLERHRLERNRTQAEMADEAGIGRATLQRLERGKSVQLTSMIKLLRTLGLLAALDAAVPESIDLPIAQLEREQRTRGSQTLARIEALRGALASLEGQRATAAAETRVLEQQIELSAVRAPVSGRIGEVAPLNVGAYVKPGDRLFSVVPPGDLRAVADFVPADALGRVRPGQSARLRLEGFPWMQYGTVSATVTRVGSELRDGRVRVELAIHPDPASSIPMQHGLPGTAEIDVERVTPARLVLRAIGARLGHPARGGAGT